MTRSFRAVLLLVAAGVLALAASAFAHVERPSYWPDPGVEIVEGLPVGGEVPKPRSLASALKPKAPSKTLVVCQGKNAGTSMKLLRASIRKARKTGWRVRPSQPLRKLSKKSARNLEKLNKSFARRCKYRHIQAAVDKADNHDRVVIMPGRYLEQPSRNMPTNDPKCKDLTQLDQSGAVTPSFRYQATCPNDQNLVYVQGREVPDAPPPSPPLENRQGIPDVGPCLKCNLQIDGTGVVPEDVIIDGGKDYEGSGPEAKPGGYAKHVDLRVDRADGFVARNFLTRGASEHGIYVEETDGYRLDTVRMFWAADYGNLTFTSDHGLYTNCDGFGAGDAVLYPGAAPETGEQTDRSFYGEPRINTTIQDCDMRGSALAYSGSMGNAVRITRNHIYGNTAGIATDSISAAGHPGFPADSVVVDHNYIYSNNLNLYRNDTPIEPRVSVPIGVGILWAGHNNGRVHDNWIFDNWRRGTMLLAVPDPIVTPDGRINAGVSCPNPLITTSCGNRYYNNKMGQKPPGFKFPEALDQFGAPHSADNAGDALPNGVDFWWDEFPLTTGNCWYGNEGPDGTARSITSDPPNIPGNCSSSVGLGAVVKEAVLLDCNFALIPDLTRGTPLGCDWANPPAKPGSAAARKQQRERRAAEQAFERSPAGAEVRRQLDKLIGRGQAGS